MKILYILIIIFVSGCSSWTPSITERKPNEVVNTDSQDPLDNPPSTTTNNLTFSGRLEIPQGSQMRRSDVQINKNVCEARHIHFGSGASLIIDLNADFSYKGTALVGTQDFSIAENKLPFNNMNYHNGKYTSYIFSAIEPLTHTIDQRYVITTDPEFKNIEKIEYEIYVRGRLQARYICEKEFIGM